jgi:hypothetical protein
MFVQVIQGRTSDGEALGAAIDRWSRDLAPEAIGWLGSTGGVTDDGRFVAVVRFENADAAQRNAARPEQTRWWEETSRNFDGEVTFRDSDDVTVDLQGSPDRAGFVQVMRGRVNDPARARELMTEMPAEILAGYRPDVLGSMIIGNDDGEWTQVVYFTSEAAAREGEHRELPLELRAPMDEMAKLSIGDTDFLDLRRPMIHSPR